MSYRLFKDPWNVLGEREIHFKSSKILKDPLIHMKPNQLINEEVLVCTSVAFGVGISRSFLRMLALAKSSKVAIRCSESSYIGP